MAYSAALGETTGATTTRRPRTVCSPIHCFPSATSGPCRSRSARSGAARSHAAAGAREHDLVLHRLPREGDRLATRASIVAVHKRKPGAFVVFRFESHDLPASR